MKVNNHAVAVTTLFCFYLVLGSINFISLAISSKKSFNALFIMHPNCTISRGLNALLHSVHSCITFRCNRQRVSNSHVSLRAEKRC